MMTVMMMARQTVVVWALDLRLTGRGFDSRPPHCRVATLQGKLRR